MAFQVLVLQPKSEDIVGAYEGKVARVLPTKHMDKYIVQSAKLRLTNTNDTGKSA